MWNLNSDKKSNVLNFYIYLFTYDASVTGFYKSEISNKWKWQDQPKYQTELS